MIESDPKVMQGNPVVKGTRITVESILEKLAAGESKAELLQAHPHLTLEGIHAALGFAAAVLRLYVSDQNSVELSAEWREEIERRMAEVDAGTAELIPGDGCYERPRSGCGRCEKTARASNETERVVWSWRSVNGNQRGEDTAYSTRSVPTG